MCPHCAPPLCTFSLPRLSAHTPELLAPRQVQRGDARRAAGDARERGVRQRLALGKPHVLDLPTAAAAAAKVRTTHTLPPSPRPPFAAAVQRDSKQSAEQVAPAMSRQRPPILCSSSRPAAPLGSTPSGAAHLAPAPAVGQPRRQRVGEAGRAPAPLLATLQVEPGPQLGQRPRHVAPLAAHARHCEHRGRRDAVRVTRRRTAAAAPGTDLRINHPQACIKGGERARGWGAEAVPRSSLASGVALR